MFREDIEDWSISAVVLDSPFSLSLTNQLLSFADFPLSV